MSGHSICIPPDISTLEGAASGMGVSLRKRGSSQGEGEEEVVGIAGAGVVRKI